MDALTILSIGEQILKRGAVVWAAYRQAAADAGADAATLANLDVKYSAAIQHERDIVAGADGTGHP